MEKLEFETRLNKVYGGDEGLNRYVNSKATILFHCDKCNTDFYNKPGHMIGRDSQRHVCTMPYGSLHGERQANVSNKGKAKKPTQKEIKKGDDLLKKLNQLVEKGVKVKSIANKLEINLNTLKFYMEYKKRG